MKHVYGWLLLTPAAILLIGFTHYPAIATLVDSFFSTGTVVRPSRFVGFENYAGLLDDAIQAALTGQKAPADALKAAQAEADRLLKSYR